MKALSKFSLIAICIFPVIFTIYLNFQNSDSPNIEEFNNDEICSVKVEDYVHFLQKGDLEYRILPSELSLFPEVENIQCLNKVMFFGESSTGLVNLGVGSSQNFYLFLISSI